MFSAICWDGGRPAPKARLKAVGRATLLLGSRGEANRWRSNEHKAAHHQTLQRRWRQSALHRPSMSMDARTQIPPPPNPKQSPNCCSCLVTSRCMNLQMGCRLEGLCTMASRTASCTLPIRDSRGPKLTAGHVPCLGSPLLRLLTRCEAHCSRPRQQYCAGGWTPNPCCRLMQRASKQQLDSTPLGPSHAAKLRLHAQPGRAQSSFGHLLRSLHFWIACRVAPCANSCPSRVLSPALELGMKV